MDMDDEKLSDGKDAECGCPAQEWAIAGVHTTIHLEPDGTAHVEFQTDQWDDEEIFDCNSFEAALIQAREWIKSMRHNTD